jgi:hypothetical protein
LNDVSSNHWADDSGNGSNRVRDAHKNSSILKSEKNSFSICLIELYKMFFQ